MQTLSTERGKKTLKVSSKQNTLIWIGGAVLVVMLMVVLGPAIKTILTTFISSEMVVNTASGQIAALLSLVTVIMIYRIIVGTKITKDVVGGTIKQYVVAAVGSVIIVILYQLIVRAIGEENEQWAVEYVNGDKSSLPLVYLVSGVIAPLYEEIFFRGVCMFAIVSILTKLNFQNIMEPHSIVVFSVVGTSLLFMFAHGSQYSSYGLLYMFLLGVWFSILSIRSKGLTVPMFAHSVIGIFTITLLLK